MSKTRSGTIKMVLPAGKATMGAPVGPSLGQAGVAAKQFCDKFNEQTRDMPAGTMVPVKVHYRNNGKNFDIAISSEQTVDKLKKLLGEKLAGQTATKAQLEAIAQEKIDDNTASSLAAMYNTIKGTARSCGLLVVE